jgi:hypothetical protein
MHLMKLAVVISSVLALGCIAQAQPADPYYGPPGGAVQAAAPPPVAVMPVPVPAQAIGVPLPPRAELRQMLLERFDANHDGRLEPRERRRAVRALRRLARRLARENARENARAGF